MLRLAEDPPETKDASSTIAWEKKLPYHPRRAVKSEVLILQAMKEAGVALVPNAYLPDIKGPMCTGESHFLTGAKRLSRRTVDFAEIESAHFYQEVMPGSQCPSNIFPPGPGAHYLDNPIDPLSGRILLKSFIESYADHQIQLCKLRFETICQLKYSQEGEVIAGPIVDPDLPFPIRRKLGPFTSLGDFHFSRIENLAYALRHRNDDEVWTVEERSRYLTLMECRKWMDSSKWLNKKRHDFYVRHEQDHLGNYLIADGKLSGVLEWQG